MPVPAHPPPSTLLSRGPGFFATFRLLGADSISSLPTTAMRVFREASLLCVWMLVVYMRECSGFAPPGWHGAGHGMLGVERISRWHRSLGQHKVYMCGRASHLPTATGVVSSSGLRRHRPSASRARLKKPGEDLTLIRAGTAAVGPGEFEWEGNLEARPVDSPILPKHPLLSRPAMPFDAPPSTTNTITTWSESEGSEAWALVMPDLQDMRKEINGLDELEREILTQLSVTSASTGVTASHSAPQLHENLESKSSLRERLSLIRMKRSALKDKVKDYQPDLDCCPLKVLGEGGEARILLGKDLSTGGDVAIKVAKRGPHDTLETEFTILNSLRNIKGFPDAIFFSRQKLRGEDVSALVMPLMGTNVLDMWFETTRGRSGLHATTVLDLGAKMLSRLEALHKIGYVHRDIKPNNFLMGGPGGNGPVCLIDMGLAVKWIPFEDPEDEVHDAGQVHHEPGSEKAMTSTPIDWTTIPSTRLDITQGGDDAMFFGTRRYCSMRAHQAKTPLSYRDDLESLAYTLAFLGCGTLPWHADDSLEDIEAGKRRAIRELREMAQEDPFFDREGQGSKPLILDGMSPPLREVIAALLLHSMDLSHNQFPDYARCKELFRRAYSAMQGCSKFPRDDSDTIWKASGDSAAQRSRTECIDMMF